MKNLFGQNILKKNLQILLILPVMLFAIGTARAGVYTVTNTNDSGAGSLRQALIDANNSAENDTINFDLPGCPCTITLTSGELPIAPNGTLTINGLGADQLSISGNNASRVFFIQQNANATISNLTITGGNSVGTFNSGFGGGIYNNVGTLTMTNSTVSGNSGTRGGGIINSGTITLTNSTVSGNSASIGGGIENWGTLTVTNSTVSGNSAANLGGGIVNSGTMTLTNSTVSGNSATNGGGVFNNVGTTNLNNLIIANSTGGDCFRSSGTINAQYSLIQEGLGCVNGTNSNNLTGDPNLGPLQDNGGPTFTHALLPGSIAIDAGSNALAVDVNCNPLTTDQRGAGFSRIVNSMVDIGAFEVQPPVVTDSDGDGVPDNVDLCPGTVLPEARPPGLKKNRFYADASGYFVDAHGTWSGFTVTDTKGCSGSQIIEAAGLGRGHLKFGITRSALIDWITMFP